MSEISSEHMQVIQELPPAVSSIIPPSIEDLIRLDHLHDVEAVERFVADNDRWPRRYPRATSDEENRLAVFIERVRRNFQGDGSGIDIGSEYLSRLFNISISVWGGMSRNCWLVIVTALERFVEREHHIPLFEEMSAWPTDVMGRNRTPRGAMYIGIWTRWFQDLERRGGGKKFAPVAERLAIIPGWRMP